MPNASTFVRAKVCNAPHMRCCAELGWRQDNRVRFPFVCGDAAACARDTFQQAQENCKARGGDLCRGNAVSTSMDDPSCPGSKTDYVWTLTKCDVNGVAGPRHSSERRGAPGTALRDEHARASSIAVLFQRVLEETKRLQYTT